MLKIKLIQSLGIYIYILPKEQSIYLYILPKEQSLLIKFNFCWHKHCKWQSDKQEWTVIIFYYLRLQLKLNKGCIMLFSVKSYIQKV